MKKFTSIKEFYSFLGYDYFPENELFDIQKTDNLTFDFPKTVEPFALYLYQIGIQKKFTCTMNYGHSRYNLEAGKLMFTKPGQIISWKDKVMNEGYVLFFHPDFLIENRLSKEIKKFNFFSYSTNEALDVIEEEEKQLMHLFDSLHKEINSKDYSIEINLSILNLILEYSNKFYKRQFLSENKNNNKVEAFNNLLDNYYNYQNTITIAPNVQTFSEQLNITPTYLSDILKANTGKTAIEHIHSKIINEAKILLKQTKHTASEIAYQLGYDSSHYFSRLFKQKTQLTPIQYRNS